MNEHRGLWHGKRLDNGEWVEGYLSKSRNVKEKPAFLKYCIDREETGLMMSYIVASETLGECTGLTDKNGKLIFEGDIIAYEDETPGQYEYHDSLFINRGIIKFADGQFYFTNSIAATMDDLLNSGILDCEVIGNIHDNPELLQKGAADELYRKENKL